VHYHALVSQTLSKYSALVCCPFSGKRVYKTQQGAKFKLGAEYRPHTFTRVYRNRGLVMPTLPALPALSRPRNSVMRRTIIALSDAAADIPSSSTSEKAPGHSMQCCLAFGPGLESVIVGERRVPSPPFARRLNHVSVCGFVFLVPIRSLPRSESTFTVVVEDSASERVEPTQRLVLQSVSVAHECPGPPVMFVEIGVGEYLAEGRSLSLASPWGLL
jgi:hypothetical protein